jgi:hypothetical protein
VGLAESGRSQINRNSLIRESRRQNTPFCTGKSLGLLLISGAVWAIIQKRSFLNFGRP